MSECGLGIALGLALLALGCRGPASETEAGSIEPPAGARASIDPAAESCASCHPSEYAHWQGSLHAQAWDNPVFRAEYEAEPSSWCEGCHNPPSRMAGNPSHGIDCASCHLREGTILALGTSPEAEAAHAITLDPELGASQRCARCHQFNHIEDGVHDPSEALQDTFVEWQASEAGRAGESCSSCHLRDHAFAGILAPELLADAVEVELEPRRMAKGLRVVVRVRGKAIGHAFPTGDVFRIARLNLRVGQGPEAVEAHVDMKRWLGRTADVDGLDSHVRTVDDTRVPPPGQGSYEQIVRLPDAAADAEAIDWTLEIHRLSPRHAKARGIAEDTAKVHVARGRVALEPE